jgi:hypothetical protein
MANRYASPGGTPEGVSYTPTKDWEYSTANWEKIKAQLQQQGASPAQIDAALQEYRQAAQTAYPGWKAAHVNQHFWQKPAFWATLPAAAYGGQAALGALGSGGAASAAGGVGTTGAGAAGGALGPSTAASLADTAGIVGGSTVPASLAALTPAELAGVGVGAGGAAAGTAAALGPSTPASLAETANVVGGGTVPASLSTGLGPVAGKSTLGKIGNWLSTPGGSTALSAGLGLVGTGIAASGQTKAAEIQAQYLREALAYEKQRDAYLQQLEAARYGDISRRLEPYQAQATTTGDALAKLLGVNPASYTYGTPEGAASSSMGPPVQMPSPMATPPKTTGTPTGLPAGDVLRGAATQAGMYGRWPFPATPPSAGTVTMRAPDGTTKQIPQDQIAHYTSRGAQVVS